MLRKSRLFLCFLLALFSFVLSRAQLSDLARIEYLNIPFSNGKNTVQRYRVVAQAPIPLDDQENQYLIIGLDYRQLHLEFDKATPFDTAPIQTTRHMQASLGYIWKFSNLSNWRFGVKTDVRVQSNLERSLVSDDFIEAFQVYAIKDMRKAENPRPYRWIFGVYHSTTPGWGIPLPIINYYREINKHWNYTVGVPKMTLRYLFDQKNTVQVYATLDYFYANIQNDIPADVLQSPKFDNPGQSISMANINAGLGYEHYFTKKLVFFVFAGYSLINEYRIRDNKRRIAYPIEYGNSISFKSGLRYKI